VKIVRGSRVDPWPRGVWHAMRCVTLRGVGVTLRGAGVCGLIACAGAGTLLAGAMSGCQGDPDFVMSDAFAKDMPLSLANMLEGAIEAQAQAQGAVMDAMAIAGAPLGPEDVAQRYEDVRVAMVVAERRARTARVRYEAAEGRMHSLVMQWKREMRVITDAASRQDSERRLEALKRAWDKVEVAAEAREDAHQDALRMVNERVLVLRHARAGNRASGAIEANPAPWPVLKAGPIQDAVLHDGDAFMRACRDMRALLPGTDQACENGSAAGATVGGSTDATMAASPSR